jgi:DNA uptake protein ComE-like DNA-binding protein
MNRYRTFVLVVAVLAAPVAAFAQVGNNDVVLNPNLAGAEQLATAPHLNAGRAATIIDARPYLGPAAFDAKLEAMGLAEEQRAEVFVVVFVPLNLNTASDDDMRLVPGVGDKMVHEFDEYRPWDGGMLRFRREIGKYVDEAEVARLEQYVFVPMDLNTASNEDLHTVPGAGDRMVYEFDEYRPYVDMAQFRREMGKYVDDGEVARLARYFVIKQ